MRVRALDAAGDMRFGQSAADFLVNTPAGVAQCAETRLGLWTGEWFLDTTEGTPYATDVLGNRTQSLYDAAIIGRLLGTPGAVGLLSYASALNSAARVLTISATLSTQFGTAAVASVLGVSRVRP